MLLTPSNNYELSFYLVLDANHFMQLGEEINLKECAENGFFKHKISSSKSVEGTFKYILRSVGVLSSCQIDVPIRRDFSILWMIWTRKKVKKCFWSMTVTNLYTALSFLWDPNRVVGKSCRTDVFWRVGEDITRSK